MKKRKTLGKKTLRRVRNAQTKASSRYTVTGKKNKKRKPVSVAKPKPKRKYTRRKTKQTDLDTRGTDTPAPVDPIAAQTAAEQEMGKRVVEAIEHGEDVSTVQPVLQGDVDPGDPKAGE